MSTRFSILIPVHNRMQYLRQTLDSVLSQDFGDYEFFVIDDGSTEPIPDWVQQCRSARFKLLRQENQGPGVARDYAASLAEGEYLCMLDSDDLLMPQALSVYDEIIRRFDSPPLILGSMKHFRDDDRVVEISHLSTQISVLHYPNYLSKDVPILISNSRLVIRKSTFGEIGGYGNGDLPLFPTEDYDLVLRSATKSPCIIVQQPYTVGRREHISNLSGNTAIVADGIIRLAEAEENGRYPGGGKNKLKRYAIIGGFAFGWATRHCWPARQRMSAVRLLSRTVPMVIAAIWNRFLRRLQKATEPTTFPWSILKQDSMREKAFRTSRK